VTIPKKISMLAHDAGAWMTVEFGLALKNFTPRIKLPARVLGPHALRH
jgi:hypothetical protein